MCVLSLFTYLLAIKNEDHFKKQLRRHSLIIGWIYCCTSIFLAFLFVWKVYKIQAFDLQYLIIDSPQAYGLLLGLQIANIAASVMLVLGVRKENRMLLLPWLVNFFISPLIYLVLLDEFYDADFIVTLRVIIVYVVSIYTWAVVFGLYQHMKHSNRNDPPSISNIFVLNLTEGSKNVDRKITTPYIFPLKGKMIESV